LLQIFIVFIEKQFDATIKTVISDNSFKFHSDPIQDFYSSRGIDVQSFCVDTPQQNEIVERKQQHLLQVTRALMFQDNLPQK